MRSAFFLYWEETDVRKRIEDSRYEAWAVPCALVRHIGGAGPGDDETRIAGCTAKHYYRSRRHYMIKQYGRLATTLAEGLEACLLGLLSAADVLFGRGVGRLRPRLQTPLFSAPPKVVAV